MYIQKSLFSHFEGCIRILICSNVSHQEVEDFNEILNCLLDSELITMQNAYSQLSKMIWCSSQNQKVSSVS